MVDSMNGTNMNHERKSAIEVGTATFESQVLRAGQPVLVAFWAPWSRPCQVINATLEEVAAACADSVKVVKVNADNSPDLSICYGIQYIPTLLVFAEGTIRARIVGTCSKEAILSKLRRDSDDGVADTHLDPSRKA